jgi:hypothetical protein
MNAHIEHELPFAVVETCLARPTTPGARAVRRDYDRINDVLAGAESEIRRSFLKAIGRRTDDEIGPVVHLVSAWKSTRRVTSPGSTWRRGDARAVALLRPLRGDDRSHRRNGSRILLTPLARHLRPVG